MGGKSSKEDQNPPDSLQQQDIDLETNQALNSQDGECARELESLSWNTDAIPTMPAAVTDIEQEPNEEETYYDALQYPLMLPDQGPFYTTLSPLPSIHRYPLHEEIKEDIVEYYKVLDTVQLPWVMSAPVLSTAQLPQVLSALKEVVKWKELLIHLGMPPHVAETIEQDHKGDIARQKMEGLLWWLRNREASWEALVGALQKSGYKSLARRLFSDKVQNHSTDSEPRCQKVFRIWRIARKYTALMAQRVFEKIVKQPLNLFFKRRFKTRGKGEEKQARWWIEVKGDQKEMLMLHTKKKEIEQMVGCHLEAKPY